MKQLIKWLDSIHDFTYIMILITLETSILVAILACYYIVQGDSLVVQTGKDLLVSIRDLLIETAVFATLSEIVIRKN